MSPLDILSGSILFEADFPRRRLDDPRAAAEAMRRLGERGVDWHPLMAAVQALAVPENHAAVPVLAELWQTCALAPVQHEAGAALLAIGTEPARAVLVAHLDDPDRALSTLAIRALFRGDPRAAFDRLAPRFDPARLDDPAGAHAAVQALDLFVPSVVVAGQEPRWTDADAPRWFAEDPRWLAVFLSQRRHPILGEYARNALRYADPALVGPALDAATRFEPPATAHAHRVASGDRVARYERGEHEAVWEELRQYSAIDGDLRAEALEVARKTMSRAKAAIAALAERLVARGWTATLTAADRGQDTPAWRAIAQIGGPLPPSLLALWEVLGGVNFAWDFARGPAPALLPGSSLATMDPLVLPTARGAVVTVAQWCAGWEGVHRSLWDPLPLGLSPDRMTKGNVAGGPPHHVVLPFLGADPVYVDGEHDLPLVDYLRLAVQWAGFPHLAAQTGTAEIAVFVGELTAGLEPF